MASLGALLIGCLSVLLRPMALRPHSCCTQCPAFKVSPWTHLPEGDLEVLTQGNEPFEAAPGEAPTLRAPSRIGAVCVRDGTVE